MNPRCSSLVLLISSMLLAAAGFAADAPPPAAPPAAAPTAAPQPDLQALIRTPKAPATPRINGARIFGARPGHPFFFHIPATGDRPMTFTATGLPDGLTIDGGTGIITGSTADAGSHKVGITATNASGSDTKTLDIEIGPTICLTPPMGWNSWNHFAGRVSDEIIRATADTMVATGLIDHGWTYVNIDDTWEGSRDANGEIQSNNKFPDMKALADYVHSKGLKFGVYSSPGPKTCAGFEATFQHEDQDAATYAKWGVDYVKYDWCSYGNIARDITLQQYADLVPDSAEQLKSLTEEERKLQSNRRRTPDEDARLKEVRTELGAIYRKMDPDKRKQIDLDVLQKPYKQFGESLAKVNRDIIFSYCQYGMGSSWEWAGALGGNCWRTTGDISANWRSMSGIGFGQNGHEKYAGPGHWNDPDMLEIGNRGLSPDECYTHMTLWCMLDAPLLIGCDMTKMDDLTASIFANDEVIGVSQDSLGKQGYRMKKDGTSEVWIKPLADGTLAVALFNRGLDTATVAATWDDLKLTGPQAVRDLWRQKDMGPQATGLSVPVASHSAELFRVGTPAA